MAKRTTVATPDEPDDDEHKRKAGGSSSKQPGARRDVEAERLEMAAKKTTERQLSAVLTMPVCKDRERRLLLETDDEEWLMWYFGAGCGLRDPFTYTFTGQQREILRALGEAIRKGGDQAIAASRGEGKTTIAERLVLKAVLSGEVSYGVLFASTGPMAENILDSIDAAITENELLFDDYPEVCFPVRELHGAPQRANTQRANGIRWDNGEPYEMAELSYSWCGNELIFPKVPGSPSAGSIIATRGLDAAVRGLKKGGMRPSLAVIDDPDTEDTSRSEEQAQKLEKRIDAAIGGLGGQRRGIGRLVLTTLQSRIAASYKYTDPKGKPTFKGRRFRFLVAPPTRADLWDEYIQMRIEDLQRRDEDGNDVDPEARRSHAFYLANREAMDAGAVVSNPNRFDDTELPDGTKREESALQHYYNLIAKLGPEVVATEYDNDPPEELAVLESGLAASRIQRQVNGHDRGIIPDGCEVLTVGIDCRKSALHWVVRAWEPGATGHTIDYGVHEVVGTQYGRDEGVDEALRKAVLSCVESLNDRGYCNTQGEVRPFDLILVDAGWQTDAIYAACAEIGLGVMPVMGFGRSSGCTSANFSEQQRRTMDKKPGDGWFLSRRGRLWLVCADADRWKTWEHDRWLTSPNKPGAMQLFGAPSEPPNRMTDDEKSHHAYARHVTNESEVEEVVKGSLRRRWKAKSENTHWLDASYYANVAASIKGIRLTHAAPSRTTAATVMSTPAQSRGAAAWQTPQPRRELPASGGKATASSVKATATATKQRPAVQTGGWFSQATRRRS